MINQEQGYRKMVKLVVTFLSLLVFLFTITPPIHAYSPTTPTVVEETPKEDEIPLKPVGEPFTPEGNLTLVDDIITNNEGDKQFITAVSKSGNYFYLVVDRAGDSNNVYLMNLVDEADIMALITGEPVGFDFNTEVEPEVEEKPEPEPEPEPEITEEPTEEKSSIVPLVGLVALGGGAAFYFLKVKPSQVPRGNPILDELDDDEDEEEEENDD